MDKRRTIPSMFHRRLLLLAGLMTLAMIILGGQLVRLSVVEGAERRRTAEVSLHRSRLLPTYRGSILDRRGRRLAEDRPGYAVAVDHDVIAGSWSVDRAREDAAAAMGLVAWNTLGPDEQAAAAEAHLASWMAHTDRLWAAVQEAGGLDDATLAERREQITRDVEDLARRVWARQRAAELKRYGGDPARYQFQPGPIREQKEAHVVLPSVSDEVAFRFRALAQTLPEGLLEVQDARRRVYPWQTAEVPLARDTLPAPIAGTGEVVIRVDGVADHLIGSMRDAQAEDLDRRPLRDPATGAIDLGGYRRVGDTVGARGLERSLEKRLRGHRGRAERRLDIGTEDRTDPVPGADVRLTIDILLQARVQAILTPAFGLTTVQPHHDHPALGAGWPLNAAAVVLDVETSEILALVSMPTWTMGRATTRRDPLRAAIDHPWVNRPVEGVYPPGSIIKPLVLVAGVTEGVQALNAPITCTGHYFPNDPDHLRCWIFRERWAYATHGDLLASEAIARSCNLYFYTVADHLGLERLTRWCADFGLGHTLGIGISGPDGLGESPGTLLSSEAIADLAPVDRRRTAISLGIGQGRGVTWTPLQAANAYAILARGGRVRDATLLLDGAGERRSGRESGDLDLDPGAVAAALEGLAGAVRDGGTGHHFTLADGRRETIINARGVTVWAKTGTAQAPPLRIADTDGNGAIDLDDDALTGLDHAWYVGLVGPEGGGPAYVVAVLVEYGGSGGRVAGPVANQIIRALQVEGYLPPALETAAAGAGRGGGAP